MIGSPLYDNAPPPDGAESTPPPRPASRWRWHHYYLLLALFDIGVILASLIIYHKTLASYGVALDDLRTIDEKLRWVAGLREGLVDLNAPGNNVFESRHPERERERFERRQRRLRKVLQKQPEYGVDLRDFRSHVEKMETEEDAVFRVFEQLDAGSADGVTETEALGRATVLMASMDRHQHDAMDTLERITETLSSQRHNLLRQYGDQLQRSVTIERYLFGAVFVILVAAYFYARKLQKTHDRMIAAHQRLLEERHARMAAVGEVCASVAHGIRNPLAGIMSSAQLSLEFDNLNETTNGRLRDILAEGKRLDYRINRLLYFSTVRNRVFESCDLTIVLRDALDEIRPQLDEHGLTLETEFPDEPLAVEGDRESLAQSIIEVVSNCIDHVPSGGTVHVSCSPDAELDGHVRIDIIDDGPGIPEAIQPHVFSLFFTSRPGGNGIGLASVKRAIEYHGGRVSVVPSNGHGAHIEILLPASQMGMTDR